VCRSSVERDRHILHDDLLKDRHRDEALRREVRFQVVRPLHLLEGDHLDAVDPDEVERAAVGLV
jgi:hypothetical protein